MGKDLAWAELAQGIDLYLFYVKVAAVEFQWDSFMQASHDHKSLHATFDEKAFHDKPFSVLNPDHKSLLKYAASLADWLNVKSFGLEVVTPQNAFGEYLNKMKVYGIRSDVNKVTLFALTKYLQFHLKND